jgi:pimeloyl-ACP methyl ester carboxylesterase
MKRRGLIYLGETRDLDDDVRSTTPGKFVELSDGIVHYELGGDSDGKTVILVPGFSVPYQIWDPTFSALKKAGYQVLRYDIFGRGFSDRPDITYDYDLFDRQLSELLRALEIVMPIDLVGLSLGGAISLVFAARHRELIRKLCLIDPAGLPWPQSLPAKLGKAPFFGELIMGLLGRRVLGSNFAEYFFGSEVYHELVRDFLAQMQFLGYKKALLSTLRSGATTGAKQAYESVGQSDIPVLLIWGKEDKVVPYALSGTAIELIPRADFHAIENAAHIPHYECPDIVNPILLDFLKR